MKSPRSRHLILIALLGACSEAKSPAAKKDVQLVAPALAEERDPLPLGERLMHEANDYPEARAAIEASLARLQDHGIALTRTRQALARPLAARYCATALTAEGLGLSLCAFADREAAEAGRARSHRSFDALIPGRSLYVQESSLLTVTQPQSDAARDEAERIRAAFAERAKHAAL